MSNQVSTIFLVLLLLSCGLFDSIKAQDLPSDQEATQTAREFEEEVFSGIVAYNEIHKFEIDLPPAMEQYRERMDDTRTTSIVVLFNEKATLSQVAAERPKEEPKVAPNDRRNRRWQMYQPKNKHVTFVDLETEEAVLQREFFDRTFLIEGNEKLKWKIKDEMSEFLGYTCMRAEAMMADTMLVEAWFTPEIPVPAGPDDFYGLPGLIVVLTTDGGNHSYVATDISLRAIDPEIMLAPTEGKKMKRDEYDKLVEEKTAEMQQMMSRFRGGRGRRGRR